MKLVATCSSVVPQLGEDRIFLPDLTGDGPGEFLPLEEALAGTWVAWVPARACIVFSTGKKQTVVWSEYAVVPGECYAPGATECEVIDYESRRILFFQFEEGWHVRRNLRFNGREFRRFLRGVPTERALVLRGPACLGCRGTLNVHPTLGLCPDCLVQLKHSPACLELRCSQVRAREAYLMRWPHACLFCSGTGAKEYPATQWDPSETDTCPRCTGKGRCPRCGHEALSYLYPEYSMFEPDNGPCFNCGWNYASLDAPLPVPPVWAFTVCQCLHDDLS